MFVLLVIFLVSLVVEVLTLLFIPAYHAGGSLNHVGILVLSLNTGVVLGALYCFVLLGFYWWYNAIPDLTNRAFIRRGVLLGIFVSLNMLLQFYSYWDFYICILSALALTAFEFILSSFSKK